MIEEIEHRAFGERLPRQSEAIEHDVGQHGVEVVAAEVCHAGRGEDLVMAPDHPDHRGVERSPAQVVHDDDIALHGEGVPVPVRVLEARRRWLVEHRSHLHPRLSECVEGDETLRTVRVGGHGDRGAQRRGARRRPAYVRSRKERVANVLDEPVSRDRLSPLRHVKVVTRAECPRRGCVRRGSCSILYGVQPPWAGRSTGSTEALTMVRESVREQRAGEGI